MLDASLAFLDMLEKEELDYSIMDDDEAISVSATPQMIKYIKISHYIENLTLKVFPKILELFLVALYGFVYSYKHTDANNLIMKMYEMLCGYINNYETIEMLPPLFDEIKSNNRKKLEKNNAKLIFNACITTINMYLSEFKPVKYNVYHSLPCDITFPQTWINSNFIKILKL